jgi:hypothetical protein
MLITEWLAGRFILSATMCRYSRGRPGSRSLSVRSRCLESDLGDFIDIRIFRFYKRPAAHGHTTKPRNPPCASKWRKRPSSRRRRRRRGFLRTGCQPAQAQVCAISAFRCIRPRRIARDGCVWAACQSLDVPAGLPGEMGTAKCRSCCLRFRTQVYRGKGTSQRRLRRHWLGIMASTGFFIAVGNLQFAI